jgi:hypothetical protein
LDCIESVYAGAAACILASHPSLNHPIDMDLSLGAPVAGRMGHPDSVAHVEKVEN